MRALRLLTFALGWLLLGGIAGAQSLPPKPARYFNDYAGVVSSAVASQLDQQLEQFEGDSSSQVVVAVFRKLPDRATLEDFTVRIAQSWGVGRSGKANGVVLFVFVDDHKMRIETGYGLEGAMPDALGKRIIEETMAPRFRAQDYDGGFVAGVNAIMQAVRGEYRGTGQTVDAQRRSNGQLPRIVPILVFIVVLIVVTRLRRGTTYYGGGRRGYSGWGGWIGGGGGGGGWSSGGGSGGGFSGGGGTFGGGGASGSW